MTWEGFRLAKREQRADFAPRPSCLLTHPQIILPWSFEALP